MKKEELFDFINPSDNDSLSDISGNDLQELLYYLENYYLEYRDKLNFDDNITFGIEMELSNSRDRYIKRKLEKITPKWEAVRDGSLNWGIELNSPILTDTKATWVNLDKVCSIVKNHSIIDGACGGHVHIGTQTIGNQMKSWLNFVKLWSVYENVICRFVYGNYLNERPNMEKYAQPLANDFWEKYLIYSKNDQFTLNEFIRSIGRYNKKQAVNFLNVKNCVSIEEKNTIEFRCPNGSMDPVIWQNNINLFINMLLYSKSPNFNNDIIDKRRELNQDNYIGLEWYKEIYLDQALEFCDLVFDNNLDKIYFLRQYLKSFEVAKNPFQKSKTFVKKG